LVLEEFGGNHSANGVTAKVFGSGRATSIAIEARDGVIATRLQRTTKDVTVDHRTSIVDAPLGTSVVVMSTMSHLTNRRVTSIEVAPLAALDHDHVVGHLGRPTVSRGGHATGSLPAPRDDVAVDVDSRYVDVAEAVVKRRTIVSVFVLPVMPGGGKS
jgi:hypothetical protein